jgi:hypothetical protein
MFLAVSKRLREEGYDKVKHTDIISRTDMKTMMMKLDESTPLGLQHKVK